MSMGMHRSRDHVGFPAQLVFPCYIMLAATHQGKYKPGMRPTSE